MVSILVLMEDSHRVVVDDTALVCFVTVSILVLMEDSHRGFVQLVAAVIQALFQSLF